MDAKEKVRQVLETYEVTFEDETQRATLKKVKKKRNTDRQISFRLKPKEYSHAKKAADSYGWTIPRLARELLRVSPVRGKHGEEADEE